MRGIAVIGANYGDEGKGLMVDHLVDRCSADLVVRFNGGPQAGHTVVTDDRRHVFSHFGAGTLQGCPTYLARDFLVNPILFNKEREKLAGLKPVVYVDPLCPVTTPLEMLLNQAVEQQRSGRRHGSCGVGIGETVEREERGTPGKINDLHLRMVDLADPLYLEERLAYLYHMWFKPRAKELGVSEVADAVHLSTFIKMFQDETVWFLKHVMLASDRIIRDEVRPETVIFEGAQGLRLDQSSPDFPHVTRSNTGMKNVVELGKQLELGSLETVYVTRAYLTRHGAGPLKHECTARDLGERVIELTNVTNTFQGGFRYGVLDLVDLGHWIREDLKHSIEVPWHQFTSIAITCLDQLDEIPVMLPYGRAATVDQLGLVGRITDMIQASRVYMSYGDTRGKINMCEAR